jgi:hypothetical protein
MERQSSDRATDALAGWDVARSIRSGELVTTQERVTDWTWGRVRERDIDVMVLKDVDHKIWMDLGWGVLHQLPVSNAVVAKTMEAMNA